jgi:hypothetical protein
MPYVNCQAFVIGIPEETVNLRFQTLNYFYLTRVKDLQVINK